MNSAGVEECAKTFTACIPEPERWLMLDGARRLDLTTDIDIDLSDPTDVTVIWLGRKIFAVPRRVLAANEPLDDQVVTAWPTDRARGSG
jgi:hypothetical protein